MSNIVSKQIPCAEDLAILERIWNLHQEDRDMLSYNKIALATGAFLLDSVVEKGYYICLFNKKWPIQWVYSTQPDTVNLQDTYFLALRERNVSNWRCCLVVAASKLRNPPKHFINLTNLKAF